MFWDHCIFFMCLFSVLVFQVWVKQEQDFGRIELKMRKYWVKKSNLDEKQVKINK